MVVAVSSEVPEAPRLELMEQDSKDSAQSSSTSSSSETQPEYNVRCVRVCPREHMEEGKKMEGGELDTRTFILP